MVKEFMYKCGRELHAYKTSNAVGGDYIDYHPMYKFEDVYYCGMCGEEFPIALVDLYIALNP